MANTYHAASGKFCQADAAKLVVKNGEKFKVVRQHRRVGLPKQVEGSVVRRKASIAERRAKWEPVSDVLRRLFAGEP